MTTLEEIAITLEKMADERKGWHDGTRSALRQAIHKLALAEQIADALLEGEVTASVITQDSKRVMNMVRDFKGIL